MILLSDTHISYLSTSSRWIVNAKTGKRVKLACVNWPGHMYPMIPEGLNKKPLKNITESIFQMGFNCVRLTWATQMFTHDSYNKLTVTESLNRWGLVAAKYGMNISNPQLMNLTLVDAQKAVVDALGEKNIMVVLDNHVSLPIWCCDWNDGNGFFKDEYFDPKEWLQGLSIVSKRYRGNPTVVAVSIRNELRGPRQNEYDWHRFMEAGANAVHLENLDVLVIVSGLSFESDLSFLKKRKLNLGMNVNKKLVYEAHWYEFGNPSEKWIFQTNEFCADITQWFVNQTGYLLTGKSPTPLFLSEFGKDQRGVNEAENRYFTCLMAFLVEKDLEWALWGLQGSYMLREGQIEWEEPYGMYDFSWDNLRNSSVLQNLQLGQQMIQEPTSDHKTYYLMYHPQTGRCVHVGKHNITTSDCYKLNRWGYSGDYGPIKLLGTSTCLTVEGEDHPVKVTNDCSSLKSVWKLVSKSRMHLAAKDDKGRDLCLDWDTLNSTIVTTKCLCLGDNMQDISWCNENPQRQWFKLVQTNI
ncbi:glycosyl hydrolase 5 family protein-like [Apium graveolens]|uniref:glycosyl hydrolase 5 family protein-like n=1 Tax=Apium graveolens TaxID=4045 RepID=UPI003D7ADC63